MSPYTTLEIERDDALKLLKKKMENGLTDAELESILFILFGEKHLSTFNILVEPIEESSWPYKFRPSDIEDWVKDLEGLERE